MCVDHAPEFILDVDHHARACWWSTSENSEKCPRVTRGNMSVSSEIANSPDLIGICEEFVGTLMQYAISNENCGQSTEWRFDGVSSLF
jgi:hypothetical protein